MTIVSWVVAAKVAEALVGLLLRCDLPTFPLSGRWTLDEVRPDMLDERTFGNTSSCAQTAPNASRLWRRRVVYSGDLPDEPWNAVLGIRHRLSVREPGEPRTKKELEQRLAVHINSGPPRVSDAFDARRPLRHPPVVGSPARKASSLKVVLRLPQVNVKSALWQVTGTLADAVKSSLA